MSTDKPTQPDHITCIAPDGRTWVEPMSERTRREIAADAAADTLFVRLMAALATTDSALQALREASAETPPKELIAAWAAQNDALTAALSDLVQDGTVLIDAVRDLLAALR